jgi:hypothetical protein
MAAATRQDHAAALEALRREGAGAMAALQSAHEEAQRTSQAEHTRLVTALRDELATTKRQSSHAVEEERSRAAIARQETAAVEKRLAATRDTIARTRALLEDMDRREEMAAAMRIRSFEQARQALTSTEGGAQPAPPSAAQPATPTSAAQPPPAPRSPGKRPSVKPRPPAEPVVEVLGLEDIELDSAD